MGKFDFMSLKNEKGEVVDKGNDVDTSAPDFTVYEAGDKVSFKIVDVELKVSQNTGNQYVNAKFALSHSEKGNGSAYDSFTCTTKSMWKHAQLFLALGWIEPDKQYSFEFFQGLWERVDAEEPSGLCIMAAPEVKGEGESEKKYNSIATYGDE